jgi:hypothetical protein
MRKGKLYYTSQWMIEEYAWSELRRLFKETGEIRIIILIARTDGEVGPLWEFEVSGILVGEIGVFYYHPEILEFYYFGDFPGSVFHGSAHFPLRRGSNSTMPYRFQRVLMEVWEQKAPKIIEYTEDIEAQLFADSFGVSW